jgi:hypothetical protein
MKLYFFTPSLRRIAAGCTKEHFVLEIDATHLGNASDLMSRVEPAAWCINSIPFVPLTLHHRLSFLFPSLPSSKPVPRSVNPHWHTSSSSFFPSHGQMRERRTDLETISNSSFVCAQQGNLITVLTEISLSLSPFLLLLLLRGPPEEQDRVSKSVDDCDTCRIICSWDWIEEEEATVAAAAFASLMDVSKTLISAIAAMDREREREKERETQAAWCVVLIT